MFPYTEHLIRKLDFICPVSPADQKNGDPTGRYTYFTSATYTLQSGRLSVGPIMQQGRLIAPGDGKTFSRGGVAILMDGRIVVGRLRVTNTAANQNVDVANGIQDSFSKDNTIAATGGNISTIPLLPSILTPVLAVGAGANLALRRVKDFMGGGALVIEGGVVVPEQDMSAVQQFDRGYNSGQLGRATFRTAIGQRSDGNVYLIITEELPSAAATRLVRTYQNLVFFDGGRGCWAHDNKGNHHTEGDNEVGFGVI